jgi:hypothetical protein
MDQESFRQHGWQILGEYYLRRVRIHPVFTAVT